MAGQDMRPAAPNIMKITPVVVNFSGSGDQTIVTGVAGQTIRIMRVLLNTGAATNLTFKDGTTALTGAMAFAANGGLVLDDSDEPWYIAADGNNFVINSSAAVQVSGTIWFTQGPPKTQIV